MTRYAVLGTPIRHSFSPVMQGAGLRARGIDAVYEAIEVTAAQCPDVMRSLAAAGGGGNVTVPHKELAARTVEVATPAVERTGACNTFWAEGGRLCGDNTDVEGFTAALEAVRPGGVPGERVLLVGAGGAARAALVALVDGGVGEVVVVNRTPERAQRLVDRLGGGVSTVRTVADVAGADFGAIVQSTSLGLRAGDPLPVHLEDLGAVGAVLDLVYGRDATPLVRRAHELGIPAQDGLEMLLQQGVAAFRRWFGAPVPVAEMRSALERVARGGGSG